MPVLDLYKEREHSIIKLADSKEYKIPKEYTVQEVERLLELRIEQEALEKEAIAEGEDERKVQLDKFDRIVFDQIEILIHHYQPDVSREYLKSIVTQNEALEMIGFFQKYRLQALKKIEQESDQEDADPKKKLSSSRS